MPKFTWDVDPILVHLGPFPLRWYSLMFVGVFLGGYWLLNWQIRRGGGDDEEAGDFIIYGVLGVLLGARFGHVLFYDLDKALADPLWVFKIWTGGLASHGAIIGLIIAMWLFTKRRRISFFEGADRFVFSASLGAMLVRIGNLFNSEIVGRKTDQTWGIQLKRYAEDPESYRYPTQIYEALVGLFMLVAMLVADKLMGKENRPRGALISLWFVLYFPLRFLVEFYKEHQVFYEGKLDMGQYLSIPGALLGVAGLVWAFKRRIPAGWYEEVGFDEDEAAAGAPKLHDPDVDAEFSGDAKKKKKKRKADATAASDAEAAEPSGDDQSPNDDAPPGEPTLATPGGKKD